MIRIILAGQYRGNEKSFGCIQHLICLLNAKIYVGSSEKWDVPFEHEWIHTPKLSILSNSTHKDNYKYVEQWSGLYGCWRGFRDQFGEEDTIIKFRNDIIFNELELPVIDYKMIYVPSIEGVHMSVKFDDKAVCNDQVVCGKKEIMDTYFNFPFKYDFNQNCLPPYYSFGNHMGIEALLRNYLYQQNIELKTFEFTYRRTI